MFGHNGIKQIQNIISKLSKKKRRTPEGLTRQKQVERGEIKTMNVINERLISSNIFFSYGEYKSKQKAKVRMLPSAIEHIQVPLNAT